MPTDTKKSSARRTDSSRKKGRRSRGPKRRVLLPVLLLLGLLLVIWGIRSLVTSGGRSASQTTGTSSASVKAIQEDVPENSYDSENFVSESDGTVSYEDESYYSVQGIDVSSHQGEIDWAALAEEGVEFAILRIGYRGYTAGGLNADEQFAANLSAAQKNGIQVGAYFYSQALSAEEAREEADYVLELLDGVTLELPVFFDWEKQTAEGSRTGNADVSILTDCALAFCQTIETGGYEAGIYFYSSLALDTYDLSVLTDYVFWLSQPGETPDFDYVFTFWQYSYTGTLDGISSDVDLDMMLVSVEDADEEQPE